MEILLLEKDKLVRDHVLVGLQSFPEFAVECGEGYRGLNRTRQKSFDCLFIGCSPEDGEGLELLERFREYDRGTDVILVTSFKKTKLLMSQKGRYNLFGVVHVPVQPREFFRLIGRLRRRQAKT